MSWLSSLFGKGGSPEQKLESIANELDHIVGSRCIGGNADSGGDGIVRFDFDSEVHPSVVEPLRQRGLEAKTFGNSLWLKKRR